MPITFPNGSIYKLCLLDTNALSEIVKHPMNEGRSFIERFPPSEFVPCFLVENLIELRRRRNVYDKFIEFFNVYPSLLAQPFTLIRNAEIAASGRAKVNDIFVNIFTGDGVPSHFVTVVDDLFHKPGIAKLEREWQNNNQDVLNTWQARKSNFNPTNPVPNAQDAKRFVEDASVQTLCQINPQLVKASIDANNVDILQSFPSMQIMLYSQYYRIFNPTWKPNDQEVTDVCISACAPYVDVVITEIFQAEIYKKVQKHINGMSAIIATLRDIRLYPNEPKTIF